MQQHHHQLPNAAPLIGMNVEELMASTLRLSDLLSEECVMLKENRIKELPKLHEEKVKLASLLEAYQHQLERDPSAIKGADAKTREELVLLADDLAFSVEENFRQVSTARAVNQRILQAIMDVMNEEHRPGTYGRQGQAIASGDIALSMNLNQKA